jgi:hypothetical protein
LYVADGDNLIGNWGGPRPEDDRRGEVVRRVDAVCARDAARAIVVFDPTRRCPAGTDRVEVRVAEAGRSADDLIRAFVDAALAPGDLTVVTSDKPLYSYARTRGAQILRVHEWGKLERRA